jgi:hypothetical protein
MVVEWVLRPRSGAYPVISASQLVEPMTVRELG